MSQNPVNDMYAPPPPAQKNRIPRWVLIVGGVIILICALIGAFACLSPVILTLMGPSIGDSFGTIVAGLGCQTENPDLTGDQCTAWAEAASHDHPDVIRACQYATSTAQANGDDGSTAVYECFLDHGIDPPQ